MLKIVLVDDNKDFLITLKEFIEGNSDAKCNVFTNPEEAAEYMLKESDVDIVVTDFQMPQMTGFELAKKLIENNFNKRIIVSSGYDTFTLAKIRTQYNLDKKVEIVEKGDLDFFSSFCE